jgi:YVTN family beta-propeller protein
MERGGSSTTSITPHHSSSTNSPSSLSSSKGSATSDFTASSSAASQTSSSASQYGLSSSTFGSVGSTLILYNNTLIAGATAITDSSFPSNYSLIPIFAMVYDSDNQFLYVSGQNGSGVSDFVMVVNTTTNQVAHTIQLPLGAGPDQMVFG